MWLCSFVRCNAGVLYTKFKDCPKRMTEPKIYLGVCVRMMMKMNVTRSTITQMNLTQNDNLDMRDGRSFWKNLNLTKPFFFFSHVLWFQHIAFTWLTLTKELGNGNEIGISQRDSGNGGGGGGGGTNNDLMLRFSSMKLFAVKCHIQHTNVYCWWTLLSVIFTDVNHFGQCYLFRIVSPEYGFLFFIRLTKKKDPNACTYSESYNRSPQFVEKRISRIQSNFEFS